MARRRGATCKTSFAFDLRVPAPVCYYFVIVASGSVGKQRIFYFRAPFATTFLSGIRKRGESAHVLFSGAFLLLLC